MREPTFFNAETGEEMKVMDGDLMPLLLRPPTSKKEILDKYGFEEPTLEERNDRFEHLLITGE